jgi:hypothetical protein
LNRTGEAIPLLERALSINEKIYGPKHPRVEALLSVLSQLQREATALTLGARSGEPATQPPTGIAETTGASDPFTALCDRRRPGST